jgi:hypothetical protein
VRSANAIGNSRIVTSPKAALRQSGGEPAVLTLVEVPYYHSRRRAAQFSNFSFPFSDEVIAMSNSVEDLQMLRLIKAFQKISDHDGRRTVVLYVEEQVERLQRDARRKLGRTEHEHDALTATIGRETQRPRVV